MLTRLVVFCLLVFPSFPAKVQANRFKFAPGNNEDLRALLIDEPIVEDSSEFEFWADELAIIRNPNLVQARDKGPRTSSQGAKQFHYNYQNIAEWGKHFPECDGVRQSPIDLDTNEMVQLHVPRPFKWQGYDKIATQMTVINNGHTVQLTGQWNGNSPPFITGGFLESEYVFYQLHFHWGPTNGRGSEHTINNRSLPLEIHLVHYKRDYGSPPEAVKHDDGLVVIGILFEHRNWEANPGIASLFQRSNEIIKPGTMVDITPFPLSIFDLDFPGEYVAYMGSLTSPPCSETVAWIIPAIPRYVSSSQA